MAVTVVVVVVVVSFDVFLLLVAVGRDDDGGATSEVPLSIPTPVSTVCVFCEEPMTLG